MTASSWKKVVLCFIGTPSANSQARAFHAGAYSCNSQRGTTARVCSSAALARPQRVIPASATACPSFPLLSSPQYSSCVSFRKAPFSSSSSSSAFSFGLGPGHPSSALCGSSSFFSISPSTAASAELQWSGSVLPDRNRRHRISRLVSHLSLSSRPSADNEGNYDEADPGRDAEFQKHDKIQVEVVRFGRLGASVDVIGRGHREEDCISEDDPPLGSGLILQKEIRFFRDGRGGLDVIIGEVLPAYVEDNCRGDGKLNISLRPPGGKTKAEELAGLILDRLEWTPGGTLQVGDKSTPEEISAAFPGISKGVFKKAIAALYKRGKVRPGPDSISLMSKDGKGGKV